MSQQGVLCKPKEAANTDVIMGFYIPGRCLQFNQSDFGALEKYADV